MSVTTAEVTTHVTTAADVRLTPTPPRQQKHHSVRRSRYLTNAAALVLAAVLVVWTLAPIYNMVMVALESKGDVFSDHIWPTKPSVESFRVVLTQSHWYLEHFWRQFANSFYMGAMTTILTLLIGSLTSFSIGRMRIRHGWLVSNAALLTYVIPASFLAIPFYRIMQNYGLSNNLWSVIAALVAFATPYAIFVLQEYGRSIPIEVDESARIDGASPVQIYWRIYVPLMAPALVAVGTYALLLAWNEYPLSVPAPVLEVEHDRAGGARAVSQQRSIAMELHDGDRDHLCAPAGRDLLRVPRPHDRRPDDGRGQGPSLATTGGRPEVASSSAAVRKRCAQRSSPIARPPSTLTVCRLHAANGRDSSRTYESVMMGARGRARLVRGGSPTVK